MKRQQSRWWWCVEVAVEIIEELCRRFDGRLKMRWSQYTGAITALLFGIGGRSWHSLSLAFVARRGGLCRHHHVFIIIVCRRCRSLSRRRRTRMKTMLHIYLFSERSFRLSLRDLSNDIVWRRMSFQCSRQFWWLTLTDASKESFFRTQKDLQLAILCHLVN